jgi:hypothetical protein
MLRGNGFENFLKIVAIYITMFISTVIISGIDHTGDIYIGGSQYSTYIGKHLMISYIIFLILIIVFKVENNAVNIYLIILLIMCIIIFMNSRILGFNVKSRNPFMSILTNPFSYYLINWIVLKNLTQYSFFIMLSYFITLSILHRVLIKFINIIKNKLNRLK